MMRLRQLLELTRPNLRADAGDLLRRNGWYQLSQGSFSNVFARDDRPFILKLFDNDDLAYLRYLRLIMTETSPHFPVVRGKPIQVTQDYHAVQLEKLDPVEGTNIKLTEYARAYTIRFINLHKEEAENYLMDKQAALFGLRSHGKAELVGPRRNAVLAPLEQYYPALAEALRRIALKVIMPSGGITDMHPANFMQRGTTLVIIDPAAYAHNDDAIEFSDIGQKPQNPQQQLDLGSDLGYRPDYASIQRRLPLPPLSPLLPLPPEEGPETRYRNPKLPFPNPA